MLSRDQVRQLDQRAINEYGIPGVVLMENAGRGCVDVLCKCGVSGPVVVCCGKGNNAGDGFVIARHLEILVIPVRVLLWCDPLVLQGDAAVNYHALSRTEVPIIRMSDEFEPDQLQRWIEGARWIVDALLGTGAAGAPRTPLDQVIDALNASDAQKMAVDLPSGLDCDTGTAAASTFRANHTCTFVDEKPGFTVDGANEYTGVVHVVSIGVPSRLIEEIRGC